MAAAEAPASASAHMPRIAIVRGSYNAAGGAERFVERIVPALAARGIAVTLIARRWPDPQATGLPATTRLLLLDPFHIGRAWRERSFADAVRQRVAQEQFDLVQSHERIAGLPVYRAGDGVHREWLAQRRRKLGPLRGWADRASGNHRAVLAAERAMFADPRLRCVVCNSDMVRGEVMRHYGVADERLTVIRNGLDLQRFGVPSQDERLALRQTLGWPGGKTVFLFVGSGFERKGVDVAIRALAASGLADRALLAVVGRDKRESRYRRLAQALGVAHAVQFAGPRQQVVPYYQAADAFVLPTLYDPQSNAVLEAMACGLPVITSTGCGSAELLDESSGHVVDALDIAGWAAAMQQLTDPQRARAMGAAGRRAIAPYSLERMTDDYLALYARLMAGPTAP